MSEISEKSSRVIGGRITPKEHSKNDYFSIIREFVELRGKEGVVWQDSIDEMYSLVMDEILEKQDAPQSLVKFGTSGWRGLLGKDIYLQSVAYVTTAIINMYLQLEVDDTLAQFLGVSSLDEARKKGCVVGFDNRFGGEVFGTAVVELLVRNGFVVHYAGESTTGVLSAAVLDLDAAFSVNLTPSHNPLEYGGFKYNAADAGPAAAELTSVITDNAQKLIKDNPVLDIKIEAGLSILDDPRVKRIDALEIWKSVVRKNKGIHGLEFNGIIQRFEDNNDCVVAIDSVHGASRLHVAGLFNNSSSSRLIHLRADKDVTFGGVAPEPSSANMKDVVKSLNERKETLKIGAIIDPDGDRIRFTDGKTEISMNQFGAMAYHFLHEVKGKKGMVAKTVATSNFANCLAQAFGEKIYEPRVGFKEFKPVIGKALVYFEESDGISIIGHTPEKDAYIGILLAVDMVLTLKKNLGEYLHELEEEYGAYYPERDGITVSLKGDKLLEALAKLDKYKTGSRVSIGTEEKKIIQVIDIDGRKMILEDGSWLMIRPSGTEPKVRFYVESRTADGTENLVQTAKDMLAEIGLL